ncbi:MAG: lysylphosphatidylglycerol synthase domain-containing protein [Shinella sp.]|nr:lysylphosphatidylglycerol synthase domain-containing protein [Shinella sp.]
MHRKIILRVLVVAAVALAAGLIYRALSQYSPAEIGASIASIPMSNFLTGVGFAALSYLCLTGFDALALRYAGHPLPYWQSALASFTSLAIGHNVGVAALSSGAVRYRFYSRWGLGAEAIAKIIVFCGVTVGLGLLTLAGVCLVAMPESVTGLSGLAPAIARALGCVCLAIVAIYLLFAAFLRGRLHFRKWSFALPSLPIACGQVLIGTVNFAFVAACLHQMLPEEAGYPQTTAAYVVANLTAIVSHVPGGLGVLEGTIAYVIGSAASIGALIAFRTAYFFIPLPFGLLSLLISEMLLRPADKRQEERNLRIKRTAGDMKA